MFDLIASTYILQRIGWYIWVASSVGLILALLLPRTARRKIVWSILVVAAFVVILVVGIYASAEQSWRLAKAKALFNERCKTAGESVPDAKLPSAGLVLLKLRPSRTNLSDQYRFDDPYGSDCHAEGCAIDLLRVSKGREINPELAEKFSGGFRWVEFFRNDGTKVRVVGVIKPERPHQVELEVVPSEKDEQPIHGLDWEDISIQTDRDYWIAGGKLRIVETSTGKTIAQRVGYMMDPAQGRMDGGRSPWAFAYDNACPRFPSVADGRAIRVGHTRSFVLKVLQPVGDQ